MLRRLTTLVVLALACSTAALAADAAPVLSPADSLPAGVPETLAAALREPGQRVTVDGTVLAELWLRRESPPTGGVNEGVLSVAFGELADSALIGVIHFPATWIDYRDTEVPAGVYTLRYWVQPADGDHMGVSQYRDFVLLLPAADDGDPATLHEKEPLLALGEKASGKVHPGVVALFPIEEEPAGGAALVRNDLDQLTLAVAFAGRVYGFVLEGHGELP